MLSKPPPVAAAQILQCLSRQTVLLMSSDHFGLTPFALVTLGFQNAVDKSWVTGHHSQLCTAGCADAVIHANVQSLIHGALHFCAYCKNHLQVPNWMRRSLLQGHKLFVSHARFMASPELKSCNAIIQTKKAKQHGPCCMSTDAYLA